MKKLFPFILPLLVLWACTINDDDHYQSDYTPILMTRSDLENSIKLIEPQEIVNYGKIYVKDNYLYINERYEGVHVINNQNPENPIPVAFITIPGNLDISIKGNYLYADNAVDLVTLQYDGTMLTEVDRNRNVFPEISETPDGGWLSSEYSEENRPEGSIIVKWEER